MIILVPLILTYIEINVLGDHERFKNSRTKMKITLGEYIGLDNVQLFFYLK